MKKKLFNIISHWKIYKNQNEMQQKIYRLKGWKVSSVSGEIRALICCLWDSKWYKYFGKHLMASLAILPKGSGTVVNSFLGKPVITCSSSPLPKSITKKIENICLHKIL